MLYSQLYRSILCACREFSRHSYTTTTLAISLPLLISVPSAYGAIVSPQLDDPSSIELSIPKNPGGMATLTDSSTQSFKSATRQQVNNRADAQLNTPVQDTRQSRQDAQSAAIILGDTQVETITVNDDARSAPAKDSTTRRNISKSGVNKRNSTKNSESINTNTIKTDIINSELVNSANTNLQQATDSSQQLNNSILDPATFATNHSNTPVSVSPLSLSNDSTVNTDEDDYIKVLDNTEISNSKRNLNDTLDNTTIESSDKEYSTSVPVEAEKSQSSKLPRTNFSGNGFSDTSSSSTSSSSTSSSSTSSSSTSSSSTSSSSTSSSSTSSSSTKQRVNDSKDLAASFEEESVQKSLERLAEFYQLQDSDLHKNNTDLNDSNKPSDLSDSSNIIDANASAPVAAPKLFGNQTNDASSYRCEGVWVTPSTDEADAAYEQTVQRAQREDGLSIANGLPLHALADYAYYDNSTYVELAGNVEVVQNGQLITADQLALDINSGVAGAKGRVLLADSGTKNYTPPTNLEELATNEPVNHQNGSGLIAVADELAYNTKDSRATAYDVAFASVPMQAHGYAQRLNKPDNTHYELDKVMFSTCPPANRKWQIEAQQIDIDTESGRGEAYDATFRLGKVPVFYLPYFNFPIDARRSSGILTPSARIDSDSGLKLSVPYYLNLTPNYDATITTDVYTNRNPMLTSEVRYLTDNYGEGKLTAAYMPNDKKYNYEDRKGAFYEHKWTSKKIPRLSADAVYSYVSDPDYISDFDDFGLVENRLNLPRRAQLNYYDDYVNTQLKVETFQTLKATDADGNVVEDKDKPYSRLPQLTVDYRLPKLEGAFDNLLITGTHDSAYFKKSINDGSENEKSGVRLFNEVGASYPLQKSWGYVTPKISLQHLYAAYDEESRLDNNINKDENVRTVFVPKFSIDSGLNFYQSGSPFGWFDNSLGGYQLLTPHAKYTYAPYKDQTNIPNFDTRVASFDYDQLFADSWFLGNDRLADNNNLSIGLNYRYIDALGVTRFDGSIGDQFFLDKPQVTLAPNDKTFDANSTGVAWKSSVQPYRNIWFDFNGALNSDSELNYVSSQLRYHPTPRSLVNLGVIERKEDPITNQSKLSAITASTVIPINANWRFMGQAQYDSRNNKFIDSTIGIDFEDCCYGFSVYGRSYYNDLNLDNRPTRAIMAEFRINGIGDRSSRLSKHLDQKIIGFEPVDTLWKK